MRIHSKLFAVLALLTLTGGPARAALQFTEVTGAAGVLYQHGYVDPPGGEFREPSDLAGGVAAGDYDADGFTDLYVVRGDIGPNLLFHDLASAETGAL